MKPRAFVWLVVWTALLLPCRAAHGQTPLFFDQIGAGHRAIALGQAFTAVADDPSAAYYNPAGLTQIPSPFMMAVGYNYSRPEIYIRVHDKDGNPYIQPPLLEQRNVNRSRDISTRGIWLGITANFGYMSVWNDPPSFLRNLSIGYVFFYSLPDINTFWNPQRKQDPYHLRFNYGYCLMSMAMSAGYRITDWLSVGAGILPRMDTFQETRRSYIDVAKFLAGDPHSFSLRLATQLKVYAEWVAGILIRPPFWGLKDRLSLGVTYRREIDGFYGTGESSDDVVVIDPVTGDKHIIFPLNARSVDYIGYNPASLTFGISVRPIPNLLLSADLTWKDYSEFKFFWALPPEPLFEDTWIPRFGLEYLFHPDLRARWLRRIETFRFQGGYYYEPSPVPDMNGEMNILDSDLHVASFGTGIDVRVRGLDLLKVQGYFQIQMAVERFLNNDRDLIFGHIWSGGEVYSAGINLSIQL